MYRYCSFILAVITASAILFFAGCASRDTELTPAQNANEILDGDHAAMDVAGDVRVKVFADAWDGLTSVEDRVVPMKVAIENRSNTPIQIRYDQFQMIGSNGRVYRALAPFEIAGTATDAAIVNPYGALTPAFTHTGFYSAPFYGPVYTGITPYSGPFSVDPFYYNERYAYMMNVDLPTQEMVEQAIPEGVLEPNGQITGFMFFEEMDAYDLRFVNFKANLLNAKSENVYATAVIPFRNEA